MSERLIRKIPDETILYVIGIVIETDLSRGSHISQSLLADKGSIENKRDRHGRLLIMDTLRYYTPFGYTSSAST